MIKRVIEYLLAALIGGAFVFMLLWSLSKTDPQYQHAPDYVEVSK